MLKDHPPEQLAAAVRAIAAGDALLSPSVTKNVIQLAYRSRLFDEPNPDPYEVRSASTSWRRRHD